MDKSDAQDAASPGRSGEQPLPVALRKAGGRTTGRDIGVQSIWASCFRLTGAHKFAAGDSVQIVVRGAERATGRVIWTGDQLVACRFTATEVGDDWRDESLAGVLAAQAGDESHGSIGAAKSFGENLLRLRQAKRLTQTQLAGSVGVSVAAVSNWEKDKSRPTGTRIDALSAVFGISAADLLGQTRLSLRQEIDEAREKVARAAGVEGARVKIIIEM